MSKIRWSIARLLDRLPGQCWADLVGWALRHRDGKQLPWSPISSSCRDGVARCGTCYCGKLRAPRNAEEVAR